MKGVSLIGCGAIGGVTARAIDSGLVNAELRYLLDADRARAEGLARSLTRQRPKIAAGVEEIAADPLTQVVVEAASQDAVLHYGRRLLEAGKELVVLSVGALLRPEAKPILEHFGSRVHVPAGAIAGLDAVKAMALAGIDEVFLVSRKHPAKLADEPYAREKGMRLEGLEEPLVVFEGTAEEAVKRFPRTLNVAAALSLCARAPVRVRVVADPRADRNVHEVLVKSKAGTLYVRVENVPHPSNPKTSYLAALSAVELLRELCSRPSPAV
ncbi:MAG: aspartate dehydrogenase [Thermofilaceae archaeon]